MTKEICITHAGAIREFAASLLARCEVYEQEHQQSSYGVRVAIPEKLKGHRELLRRVFVQSPFLFVDKVRLRVDKRGDLWLTLVWSKKS